jgi:hypothetical protein
MSYWHPQPLLLVRSDLLQPDQPTFIAPFLRAASEEAIPLANEKAQGRIPGPEST